MINPLDFFKRYKDDRWYKYQRPNGHWVTLPGGENPTRIPMGYKNDPGPDYIEMPDVPRDKGYAEVAYYVGEGMFWRTSANVGKGFMRFGQHFIQGLLYGAFLGFLPTFPIGMALFWLAGKYQDGESRDINDKAWYEWRGLGAGASVMAVAMLPANYHALLWLLERL